MVARRVSGLGLLSRRLGTAARSLDFLLGSVCVGVGSLVKGVGYLDGQSVFFRSRRRGGGRELVLGLCVPE